MKEKGEKLCVKLAFAKSQASDQLVIGLYWLVKKTKAGKYNRNT